MITILDEVIKEMEEASKAKLLPFPHPRTISLIEAASYIKSFTRSDLLKYLHKLKAQSEIAPITTEDLDRLIEDIIVNYQ